MTLAAKFSPNVSHVAKKNTLWKVKRSAMSADRNRESEKSGRRASLAPCALQNSRQNIIGQMSQVLTVGAESLAAGFATRDDDTRST
jgi:hypothetical protein